MAEKLGMSEPGPSPGESAEGVRRSSRIRTPVATAAPSQIGPGEPAMKAAYAYLEGDFESPQAAGDNYGASRQLVNYYVRKLSAAGVQRSEKSSESATAPSTAPVIQEEQEEPAYQRWCCAWAYAAEMCKSMGYRAAARATRETHKAHVDKLKVEELKALLTFKAVDFPTAAKKPMLRDLAKQLQLQSDDVVPPLALPPPPVRQPASDPAMCSAVSMEGDEEEEETDAEQSDFDDC